jgi:predicted nucleic acid-binding protein
MIGIDTTFLVAWEMDEHPSHSHCRTRMAELVSRGQGFALTSAVIAEFVHVVTDGKRFQNPLNINIALDRAAFWRDAAEVSHVEPNLSSLATFDLWMRTHRLGRKRVLDTMLAATLYCCGATDILTINSADFTVFGCFQFPLQ